MSKYSHQKNPMVSIIIPVKNEENFIEKCLESVFNQETDLKFEVLVIDSGSVDKTPALVDRFKTVKRMAIKADEFAHGRTRNFGAENSSGEFLVFLNADAIPADKHWLNQLLETINADRKIAGVFSRHLPREDCYLYMVRDLLKSMPDKKIVRTGFNRFDTMLFSTVSAIIRREIWLKYPFEDDILIAEDQEWGKQILNKGYKIIYQPDSRVYHSHNYSNTALYRLKKAVGQSIKLFDSRVLNIILGPVFTVGGMAIKIGGDFCFIIRQRMTLKRKFRELGISIGARVMGFLGRYAGWITKHG
jgi:rhamnosyltransferase